MVYFGLPWCLSIPMSNDQLVVVGFELQMRVSLRWSEMVCLRKFDWRGDGGQLIILQGLQVSTAMFFNLNQSS